jgi:hypothetical protein
VPSPAEGLPLKPFFRLHDARYQMYWPLTTPQELDARRERLAAAERARAALEAATLDRVAVGEQQPEVEHDFAGERTETGIQNGRRWRRGDWFQYSLDTGGERAADLAVTFWNDARGSQIDVQVNDRLVVREELADTTPGQVVERRYSVPADLLAAATDGRLTVRLAEAPGKPAPRVLEVRLMRAGEPGARDATD